MKPKPVERQKVYTCLRVFCEETYTALRVHPEMKEEDVHGTALFLEKVVAMWKILNVKSIGKDIRHNNPLEAEIRSTDDPRLQYLLDMADMFLNMTKTPGGKRSKTLTKDTGTGLHHTLHGIVELTRQQLETTHEYVTTNDFCSDPIEASYGIIREGTGGTYFITVQNCMEKLDIAKTKLLLQLNADVYNFTEDIGHYCEKCKYFMDEHASEIFHSLEQLEGEIPDATKMSLCHMAGYVTRKDPAETEERLLGTTTFYFQKYGKFTNSLDRGGLKVPTDTACQWTFFGYIMFNAVKEVVCRKSLTNLLMIISDIHTFNMERRHGLILSNMFFKNHCVQNTPRSTKEAKQKVLKLSEES